MRGPCPRTSPKCPRQWWSYIFFHSGQSLSLCSSHNGGIAARVCELPRPTTMLKGIGQNKCGLQWLPSPAEHVIPLKLRVQRNFHKNSACIFLASYGILEGLALCLGSCSQQAAGHAIFLLSGKRSLWDTGRAISRLVHQDTLPCEIWKVNNVWDQRKECNYSQGKCKLLNHAFQSELRLKG